MDPCAASEFLQEHLQLFLALLLLFWRLWIRRKVIVDREHRGSLQALRNFRVEEDLPDPLQQSQELVPRDRSSAPEHVVEVWLLDRQHEHLQALRWIHRAEG